jgi:preprotein translocase subunit SecG
MEQIVLIVHVLVALAIIGLIMIQQGKGADMGASFGAGASQTLFGSGGGGNVLTSATSWLVTLFFATSVGLAVIAKENSMAAGNVDLPMPAVIESFEMPADVRESDIPGVDAAVFEEIPGADVPVEGSGSDIPGL